MARPARQKIVARASDQPVIAAQSKDAVIAVVARQAVGIAAAGEVFDRVQPVMLNIWADGGTWAEYGVTWDQLEARVGQRVARGAPRLWDWVAARARAWFGPAA